MAEPRSVIWHFTPTPIKGLEQKPGIRFVTPVDRIEPHGKKIRVWFANGKHYDLSKKQQRRTPPPPLSS